MKSACSGPRLSDLRRDDEKQRRQQIDRKGYVNAYPGARHTDQVGDHANKRFQNDVRVLCVSELRLDQVAKDVPITLSLHDALPI